MTAVAYKFRAPYVSQMLAEPDRTYDDCAASVGIMLAADWTCGEWLIEPDGETRPVLTLRNEVRRRIGDTDGSLTFHDVNDFLHVYDPDLPPLPRYGGQTAKPGQSTQGATLSLDKDELKALLRDGHSAGICGYSGTVGHVIHITDGNAAGVLVKDPLTRNKPGWKGMRRSWEWLWDFTERKVNGDRYGSPTALAVAVVKVGDETAAKRAAELSRKALAKATERLDAAKAQTALATEERDAARADAERLNSLLAATAADLAACQAATPTDCTAASNAAVNETVDAIVASLGRWKRGVVV